MTAKRAGVKTAKRKPSKPTASRSTATKEPARPVVLGLLPTPPEVAELVEREVRRLPMSDAARLRLTDGFNLQYYCGGEHAAYRNTPQGVEVLAVGSKGIRKLLRESSEPELVGVIFDQPEPW